MAEEEVCGDTLIKLVKLITVKKVSFRQNERSGRLFFLIITLNVTCWWLNQFYPCGVKPLSKITIQNLNIIRKGICLNVIRTDFYQLRIVSDSIMQNTGRWRIPMAKVKVKKYCQDNGEQFLRWSRVQWFSKLQIYKQGKRTWIN